MAVEQKGPGQQLVEPRGGMAISDGFQCRLQIGERLHAIRWGGAFATLDIGRMDLTWQFAEVGSTARVLDRVCYAQDRPMQLVGGDWMGNSDP